MAQPAYNKLIKNGEKNLEIVGSGQQRGWEKTLS